MTANFNLPVNQIMPEKDVRIWAAAIYLSGLTGYIVPFGNLIAPLFIWLLKKDDHPFLNNHGKDVVNFQLTILFWIGIMALIYFVLLIIFTALNLTPLFIILVPALYLFGLITFIFALANLILMIIGAVKVYQGKAFTLPMTISFLK
jgi:uncharacterized Tic20 family protein